MLICVMASPCRAGVPYELVGMEHVSVLGGTQAPGPLFFLLARHGDRYTDPY